VRRSGWLLSVSTLVLAAASTSVFAANCTGAGAAPAEIRIASGGATRTVAVHFGKGYDGRKPRPLVLDLHASGSNAAAQGRISGMGAAADRHGFVVAWPEGAVQIDPSSDGHYWNIPGVPLANGAATPAAAMDDTKFIEDLIAHMTAEACIDPRAVFVTGLSGGARMSSHLACRLSGQIAAIAPVGGLRAGRARADNLAAVESDSCKPARPVAVVAFHGTDDAVNAYQGGSAPHWGYAVPVALERWAAANGCEARPESTPFAAAVTRKFYRGCRANTVVELYSIETARENGGGHTWPGSTSPIPEGMRVTLGLPSRTLDATEIMSQFFVKYRRE
jgi:polyhydroxybutyrate depolymerase